jgi:hypothetical protein
MKRTMCGGYHFWKLWTRSRQETADYGTDGNVLQLKFSDAKYLVTPTGWKRVAA